MRSRLLRGHSALVKGWSPIRTKIVAIFEKSSQTLPIRKAPRARRNDEDHCKLSETTFPSSIKCEKVLKIEPSVMATDSGSATKGKRAGGKRGHPPATNNDASRTMKPDNVELEENVNPTPPPSKKRRSLINYSAASASPEVLVVKDQKSVNSPATPATKSGRAASRTPARGRVSVKVEPQSPVSNQGTPSKSTANAKPVVPVVEEWSTDDLGKLVENVSTMLPKVDNVKYSTQVERLEWDKVSFDNYSGKDCKEKWSTIMTKLRRYRTLSELVNDAREWVKHPWMTYNNTKGKPKPPGLPKKPLTPYFRYFLEKREKYSRDNPEMSMTELAKLLAKKYAELPEKKKQKYKEGYDKENEVYKAAMEKYKEEHPDIYPGTETKAKAQSKQNGPQKAQTPIQLFLADKMSKHVNESGSNKKEVEEKYRNQWKNLSNNKRVRWIKKAMADEERFAAELVEYRLLHPDYKPEHKKSTISKAEKEIKDRIDGKPDRPPNSGYSLYSKIMLKELKDIPSKEKMGEISRRWKELSEKERQGYAKQATEAITRYQQDYKLYLASLPEEERKKLEDAEKSRKKRPTTTKAAQAAASQKLSPNDQSDSNTSRPKKPLSAQFFYQKEKLAAYKAKQPEKSEQELLRFIVREYNDLSEKKKEKYKKLAEDAKKSYEQTSTTKEKELKNKIVKTEPKKPPQSGYSVFTSEMMSKLVDVEPKARMGEISKRWGALSAAEKEKYKKQATVMGKKYVKDIQKFLSTLTEEEQKIYQQIKAKKPARRNAKVAVAAVKLEKDESSSSSDEESNKEDEDNKDSSSTGSGSASGSDSSSESDESDSDSDSDSKSEDSGSDKDDSDDDNDKNDKDSGNSSSGDSDGDSNSASASESDSEEE